MKEFIITDLILNRDWSEVLTRDSRRKIVYYMLCECLYAEY